MDGEVLVKSEEESQELREIGDDMGKHNTQHGLIGHSHLWDQKPPPREARPSRRTESDWERQRVVE
jgi:hypothetical protein